MKINYRIILCLSIVTILLFSTNAIAMTITKKTDTSNRDDNIIKNNDFILTSDESDDIDPLVDLSIKITIKEIRALDKIDLLSDPDFYVKVFVESEMKESPVWHNQKYVDEEWTAEFDVPDDQANINVTIQLWDWNPFVHKLCDLSENNELLTNKRDIDLIYNLQTAHWFGEDYNIPIHSFGDLSGYGRLNGCDDNSIYQNDLDCLILFEITQTDYDNDGFPYWIETQVYNTSPLVDDTGRDDDNDSIPIEWEFKWGSALYYNWHRENLTFYKYYDPFKWENHTSNDPDDDALTNYEEYLTSEWDSDPFRKDVFVELDEMAAGPNCEEQCIFPEGGKDLMRDAFDRQNIVFHLDDGCMGGGEIIPFDNEGDNTTREELDQIYFDYFLCGDNDSWRRGVFHYGVLVYNSTFTGFNYKLDAFQISKKWVDRNKVIPTQKREDLVYASVYMHELGHSLGIRIPGGHDRQAYYPWQLNWWKYRAYRSCMNYGYTYVIVDYSDGSRGKNDYDDWSNLDYYYFQLNLEG
jgi:hypothetical protein